MDTIKLNTIKIFTLFSGYDSQLMGIINAVKNSKKHFDVELVGWSDNDPDVQRIHNLTFPEYADRCYPDVTTIEWKQIPFFDILFYSSPCQSASRSGRREGFEKDSGTKSSLVWAVEKAIACKRPKWLVLENVEGYLDPQNEKTLIKWARTIASYGYVSFFKVLNSADFGIPQNRSRIFMISMRIDNEKDFTFQWPNTKKLTVKPEGLLEDKVDDKYYLSVEMVNTYIDLLRNASDGYTCSVKYKLDYPTKYFSSQFTGKISSTVTPLTKNGAIPTLQTGCGCTNLVAYASCRQEGLPCVVEVWEGEKGILPIELKAEKPCSQTPKAKKKPKGSEKILSIIDNLEESQYLRIRQLTPKECLRFMGVEDMYIERMLYPYKALAKEGYTEEQVTSLMTIDGKYRKVSDYALYGRAGNSIVVDVLTAIFTSLIKQYPNSFGEYCGKSPEEIKALKKREYARRHYEKHKAEVQRKSREYHKQKRMNKLMKPNGNLMSDEEIARIIRVILSSTEDVVKQLRVEKKEKGDYSKEVTIQSEGINMVFSANTFLGSYPPISVNLTFNVSVMIGGKEIIRAKVAPIKHRFVYFGYSDYRNESAKFKMDAFYCENSHLAPLFKSGDTLCIANNNKVAYAKAEILSEKREGEYITRTVRLRKELGHTETLAYEKGYPEEVATYQVDESTEQYFGGKDSIERVIKSYYVNGEKKHSDVHWFFYTGECTAYDSEVQLAEPLTPEEVLLSLKNKALKTLLDDCRGEFCYGDPRVKTYRKYYLILGEKNIDIIYKDYMKWLKEHCTTYPEDSVSGEFTGIAVDWHGKEALQPVYDVSGDSVVVKNPSLERMEKRKD